MNSHDAQGHKASDVPPENNPTRFARLVDQKHSLLSALLEKGLAQRQLIETGDATGLLHLLAEKQNLISTLMEVQDAIACFEASDSRVTVAWTSPAQREHCLAVAQQCNAIGKQVLEIEAVCEQNALAQRDAMAKQIQQFANFDSRSFDSNGPEDETNLAEFDESS